MARDLTAASKAVFDTDATGYDQSLKYAPVRNAYGRIAAEALQRPFHRWLDVGCGTGSLLQMIGQANRAAERFGVDFSRPMIDAARSKLGPSVELKVAESDALPFADEEFDLVTCTFSFHHYTKPGQVLGEMRRVLAPGGRVIIADPSPFFPLRPIVNVLVRFANDGTVRFYSRGELQRLGAPVGLVESKWTRLNWHSFLVVAQRAT